MTSAIDLDLAHQLARGARQRRWMVGLVSATGEPANSDLERWLLRLYLVGYSWRWQPDHRRIRLTAFDPAAAEVRQLCWVVAETAAGLSLRRRSNRRPSLTFARVLRLRAQDLEAGVRQLNDSARSALRALVEVVSIIRESRSVYLRSGHVLVRLAERLATGGLPALEAVLGLAAEWRMPLEELVEVALAIGP